MSHDPRHEVTTAALDRVEQRAAEVERTDLDRAIGRVLDIINERDRRYEVQFAAAKEAVTKAEEANEKRFASVNEFRGQLGDQARTFIPRLEAEHRIGANEGKIRELDARLIAISAARAGTKDVWGYIVGGVGVLLAVASFFLANFVRR